MLKLKDIANYYHKQYKAKKTNVLAYPSLNTLTAFVKEPTFNLWIVINCHSDNFTNNYKWSIQNMADKTPIEMLQEAFYYHKINQLVQKPLHNGTDLKNLGIQKHFKVNITPKADGFESYSKTWQVNNDELLLGRLNDTFKHFQKLYTEIMQHPDKYFVMKSAQKMSKKEIENAKKQIYQTDFKK